MLTESLGPFGHQRLLVRNGWALPTSREGSTARTPGISRSLSSSVESAEPTPTPISASISVTWKPAFSKSRRTLGHPSSTRTFTFTAERFPIVDSQGRGPTATASGCKLQHQGTRPSLHAHQPLLSGPPQHARMLDSLEALVKLGSLHQPSSNVC